MRTFLSPKYDKYNNKRFYFNKVGSSLTMYKWTKKVATYINCINITRINVFNDNFDNVFINLSVSLVRSLNYYNIKLKYRYALIGFTL